MEPDVLTSRLPHIKQALLSAIEQQKIDLVYQGQNALPSQQLVGLEVLCRIGPGPWGHVTPDQFIPVAEQIGLIAPLERLVFKQLAQDLPQLLAAYPDIRIGVNLSIRHISALDFYLSSTAGSMPCRHPPWCVWILKSPRPTSSAFPTR